MDIEQSRNYARAEWKRAYQKRRYATDQEYRRKMLERVRAYPAPVHAAHMRVYKALKRGELVRPSICDLCGGGGFIEAAHRNYFERLAVDWLCRSCHRKWDKQSPKMSDQVYVAPAKSHCKHGHEFTPENTYFNPDGRGRQCKECRRIRSAAFEVKRKAG